MHVRNNYVTCIDLSSYMDYHLFFNYIGMLQMRKEITTREIADRFGKGHWTILKSIRDRAENENIVNMLFSEGSYASLQNKKLSMYTMGVEGFCILTDTWGFSRGNSAYIKATILNEFGERFSVCASSKSRGEDDFYERLKRFIPDQEIIREFPISKYKVDFYISGVSLIIEYDESYHSVAATVKKDQDRFYAINEFLKEETDDGIDMIRVKSSDEEAGLMRIASYLALHATNDICRYYEEYQDEHPEYMAMP